MNCCMYVDVLVCVVCWCCCEECGCGCFELCGVWCFVVCGYLCVMVVE